MGRKKYPYFRFTQRLKTANNIRYWYEYFKDKDIPVAIIKEFIGRSKLQYAVWIIGLEYNPKEELRNTEKIKPNSILINSSNDFLLKAKLQINSEDIISVR